MTENRAAVRPHRARRGEGDLLRTEVMDAAEELLVRHGSPEAVSMRAIAKRVGVTPPAIYLHFADKEALFFAVCDRRFVAFSEQVVAALGSAGPDASVTEQLVILGRAYIDWGLANPQHYAILFGGAITVPEGLDPTALRGRLALDTLISLIERGVAEGVFAIDDPVTGALTMWAGVHGYVELATIKQEFVPDIDVRARRDKVLELLVRSLLA